MEIKIDKDCILLEKQDVFLYKFGFNINQKPGYFHKAKDWDVTNPDGCCKLILYAISEDLCHIRLQDEGGKFVGHSLIDCFPGSAFASSSLGCVVDSSRYFTLKMTNSSGNYELVGLGFSSRNDSSDLTKTLLKYFVSTASIVQEKSVCSNASITPTISAQCEIEVEMNSEVRSQTLIKVETVDIDNGEGNNSDVHCRATKANAIIPEHEIISHQNDCQIEQEFPLAGYPSYLISQKHENPFKKIRNRNFNYNCVLCSSSFSNTTLLKEHIEIKHKDKASSVLFYCDHKNCGERFLSELTRSRHGIEVHAVNITNENENGSSPGEESLSASNHCGSKMNGIANGKPNETRSKTKPKRTTAELTLSSDPYISVPIVYRNAANKLICHLCSTILPSGKKLEAHWNTVHLLNNPIVCRICSLVFFYQSDFDRHRRALHPKGYSCPLCSQFKESEISLRDHAKERHNRNFLVSL